MCSWYIYASDSWNPRKKNSAILHYFCSLPLVGYLNILITYSIHLFFFSSIEIVWANSANLCFLCILAVLSSLDHRKQLVQNSSILCSLSVTSGGDDLLSPSCGVSCPVIWVTCWEEFSKPPPDCLILKQKTTSVTNKLKIRLRAPPFRKTNCGNHKAQEETITFNFLN